MDMNAPLEIERKYLIAMPHPSFLEQGTKWEIVQTYLTPKGSEDNRRVRRSEHNGHVVYTHTAKTRVTPLACYEEEAEITEEAYEEALADIRPESMPVHKTRYKIPYGNHILEIDIYPFWQDVAVLEVELKDEGDILTLPQELLVLREVTGEGRYKNTSIAKWLWAHPDTPLPL